MQTTVKLLLVKASLIGSCYFKKHPKNLVLYKLTTVSKGEELKIFVL